MALSIISINVNGLRDPDKRAGLIQWLHALPRLMLSVCKNVIVFTMEECTLWFPSSGLFCAVSPGSNHSCGCIVFLRPSLSVVRSWYDDHGRFFQCEFSYLGKIFRVACVYAPNRYPEPNNFFSDVEVHVDPSVPTLLCGDFNAVFDLLFDRVGSEPSDTVRESSVALSHLFSSCCVLDIWRYLHPSSNSFTWSSSVAACDILPIPFSDHCPVCLSVSVPDAISFWPWSLEVKFVCS